MRTMLVGRKELGTSFPGMFDAAEPTGITVPVLGGFELAFAEGIVIA